MNTTRCIREYMRDHQGKMVHVSTTSETVDGIVHFVGRNGVWLVTPSDEDRIIGYDALRGYSEKAMP